MIPSFPAGSGSMRLGDAAKAAGISAATMSRLVNGKSAWRRCAIAGITGSRVWGIDVAKAVAAGLARYSTGEKPAFTARDLVEQVKADLAQLTNHAQAALAEAERTLTPAD